MSTLPDLQMDVTGQFTGNAYPEQADYRVIAERGEDLDTYVVLVEDASGSIVGRQVLRAEEARDLIDMASRDHSLDGFDDDWDLPAGIERTIHWTLAANENVFVRLNTYQIDEVAAWLRFATGEQEWEGGDVWEY